LYLAISVGAAVLVGTSILILADMDLQYRAGLAVYFSTAVAALPWMLLRRVAAAIDLFLEFELLEFCRRLAFLFLSLAMLLGLGLLSFAVLCMFTWLLAFSLAFRRLNRNSLKLRLVLLPSAFAHARDNFPNIARTGAFTLLEFAILNFPYILVSNQFRADSLIAFDVFFKLTRLGQFAYSVPVETMLPSQTAAFHGNDRRAVIANFFRVFALGSLALMPLTAIILAFGDELFRLLLKREDYVDAELRFTMVVMLSATLVQMSAGMLLTGTGRYSLLLKSTLVTSSLMAGLAAATVCFQITFIQFMIAYVLVYSLHAMLFLSCFLLTIPAQQLNDSR
jgi:O-antigen/teichoic acid export membrane protein